MTAHVTLPQRMLVLALLLLVGATGWSTADASCPPRADLALQTLRDATQAVERMDVQITAAGSVDGGDRLVKIRFGSASNAVIRIGATVQAVPSVVPLPAGTSTWSFSVTRDRTAEPFMVSFVVTDLCGDVHKFVGAGEEVVRPRVSPVPVVGDPRCPLTLQQQVNQAPAGSRLIVPACVYRESVTIAKPLFLDASPGAEIRGSDVWTSWTRVGGLWSAGGLPSFVGHGECRAEVGDRCRRREQVFRDGVPLVQVASNPGSGQFTISNGTVFLADDPNGHTIEVSTRAFWVRGGASDVTIRGFIMRHAAVDAQDGGVANRGHSRWTIQDSILLDAHGAGLSLNGGSGHRLLRSTLGRHGQEGAHLTDTTDVLFQDNRIQGNNTEGFNPEWESGGIKVTETTRLTLDDNEVSHNGGPGLWCDLNCHDLVITNNRVFDNERAGVLFEISDGARIIDNALWENGWGYTPWGWGGGIVVSTSRNVEVARNTLAWNADGIAVIEQDRGGTYAATNVTVTGNVILAAPQHGSSYGLAWLSDVAVDRMHEPSSANLGSQNLYWSPTPDNGTFRFGWTDDLNLLAEFNATPGEEGARYLTTTEKNQALGAKGIPTAPRPR